MQDGRPALQELDGNLVSHRRQLRGDGLHSATRHTHGEHKRLFSGGRDRQSVSGGRERLAVSERWKQRSAAFKRMAPALRNRTVEYSSDEAAQELSQADTVAQVPHLPEMWM